MTCPSQRRLANSAIAGLAALLATALADPAGTRSSREAAELEFTASRAAGTPLLAVVSLRDQRVTFYDAEGKILQAPVSTGRTGYETPAGIYSVIQKEAEHYSNLYDDASMPYMHRITWSGIALHAGVLPGYPASHGCIRMPHGFAERLFEVTKLGLRVAIVRDDMSPVEISHPALFKPGPIRSELAAAAQPADPSSDISPTRQMRLGALPPDAQPPRTWRAVAAAKRAEAEKAAEKSEQARRAAVGASADAARFVKSQRIAEVARRRAESQLEAVERELADKTTPELEERKAAALSRLSEAQAQLDAIKAEGQSKIDAAAAAREAARAAELARTTAVTEAKIAENKVAPVSVFVSRQTQTLYVRQGFRPIFDTPVTIRDPDTPIGTTIFTAVSYADDGENVRWNALAMYPGAGTAEPAATSAGKSQQRRSPQRQPEPVATDVAAAKAALERVAIPQEAIERIAEFVSPGSALIISDETLSRETSKGTDFIVLMSGEPQGGIKIRRRTPYSGYGSDRLYRRQPYYGGGSPFPWW